MSRQCQWQQFPTFSFSSSHRGSQRIPPWWSEGRADRQALTCAGSPPMDRSQPSICLQRSTRWGGKRGRSGTLWCSCRWSDRPRLPPATHSPGPGDPWISTVNSNPWMWSVQVSVGHRSGLTEAATAELPVYREACCFAKLNWTQSMGENRIWLWISISAINVTAVSPQSPLF